MKFDLTVVLVALATPASSVLYGDEQFGDKEGGRFWAFHSGGVSIVNPSSCNVERTFEKDAEGTFLPNSWFDGVYMENDNGNGYVAINSGVTHFDGHENLEGGAGEVLFFSTNPTDYNDPVKSRVIVGGRPVHSYAVHTRNEFWTHSDADGFFYVINLDDIKKHSGAPIKANVDEANHGKLLWDENAHLSDHGFATSTGEQHLFIIDMTAKTQVGTYDFSGDVTQGTCRGTHAIAYSSKNQHLYLECSGGGGTLEFDVANPLAPVFVFQHADATGSLYETPDEAFVVASDKTNNALHIFRSNGSGSASSIGYVVDVPGHPSTVSFYPILDADVSGDIALRNRKLLAPIDYNLCMPLTENTNHNHMDDNENIVCDYYGCSGASSAVDVANGICHYDASGRFLQQALIDDIESVKAKVEPYGNSCAHCENEMNYNDGVCECTPFCGSCADEDYDGSLSGVMCVTLNDVINGGKNEATFIKGAGSVRQGKPYAYSPQCGFGRTYRTHKRGGIYHASVAHFPTNSLQIINMKTQAFHCAADLPGSPSRVVYVPPQPGQNEKSGDSSLSTGVIVGIAAASFVGVLLLLGVAYRFRSKQTHSHGTSDITENEMS